MKIAKLLLAAVIVSSVLYSCTQEGPVGPTGPTGTTGPVASTLYTPGTLYSTSWLLDTVSHNIADSNVYYQVFSEPNIMHYATDNVAIYVQDTAATDKVDYFALPTSNNVPIPNATLSYSYRNDTVMFYYQNVTGITIPPIYNLNVKVIVIPDGIMKQHPGLNLADYKAVMALVKPGSNK
jgi:hypothetical protein